MWKFIYKLYDVNYFGYVCKYLYVYSCMGEYKYLVFGKYMKDEYNVRLGNF